MQKSNSLSWKASRNVFVAHWIDTVTLKGKRGNIMAYKKILAIGGKCQDWFIRKRKDYLTNRIIVASKGLRALNKGELS